MKFNLHLLKTLKNNNVLITSRKKFMNPYPFEREGLRGLTFSLIFDVRI
jgi:hypothetical protein